jgi:hypothetical protein
MTLGFANCDDKQDRRWMRYNLASPLPVVVYSNDQLQVDALGNVIGEGGVSLFVVADLPIGVEVEMLFTYSHSVQPIRMRGVVRNRAAYLFGIEFLVQSAVDRMEFARLSKVFSTEVRLN